MPDRDWTSGGLFENGRVLRLTLAQSTEQGPSAAEARVAGRDHDPR